MEEKKPVPKEYLDKAKYLIERGYVSGEDAKDAKKLAEKILKKSEKS
tara:strand:+ start:4810 stop:4950 length:141 start_codon:yes stop_codon:yes gene_type:complete